MEECPICLSPLSGSITTVGCCKKQFHAGCILRCTKTKNECPMCRVKECIIEIPEETVVVLVPQEDRHTVARKALSVLLVLCIGIATIKVVTHV